MDKERIDWLMHQYLAAIQNDGDWHRATRQAVEADKFGMFRRITGNYIDVISRDLRRCGMMGPNERLSSEDWAYINMELWLDEGCEFEFILKDPGPCGADTFWKLQKGAINNHINKAQEHFDSVAEQLKENHAMQTNPNIAIETKTIIFGQDAATMSESDLIGAIKKVEGDIAKLKEVKTTSKKIASNIETLESQLAQIVAVLDAR